MQTALRRARVKMMYSEGFNPHMKITFALPLSIGIESVCEYMDIKTDGSVSPDDVKNNLSKNLPTDMKVLEVYEAQSKLTDIKYAEYMIYLDYGEDTEKAVEIGNRIFSGSLVVTKRTKKGEKEVDISPMIKDVSCSYEYGLVVLKARVCADSENYLNPFYLTGALDKEMGVEAGHRRVVRTQTYFADEQVFA
jgi:radical SAM-linked protein